MVTVASEPTDIFPSENVLLRSLAVPDTDGAPKNYIYVALLPLIPLPSERLPTGVVKKFTSGPYGFFPIGYFGHNTIKLVSLLHNKFEVESEVSRRLLTDLQAVCESGSVVVSKVSASSEYLRLFFPPNLWAIFNVICTYRFRMLAYLYLCVVPLLPQYISWGCYLYSANLYPDERRYRDRATYSQLFFTASDFHLLSLIWPTFSVVFILSFLPILALQRYRHLNLTAVPSLRAVLAEQAEYMAAHGLRCHIFAANIDGWVFDECCPRQHHRTRCDWIRPRMVAPPLLYLCVQKLQYASPDRLNASTRLDEIEDVASTSFV